MFECFKCCQKRMLQFTHNANPHCGLPQCFPPPLLAIRLPFSCGRLLWRAYNATTVMASFLPSFTGESIPIRLFLNGYDLTPTMRDINKKFSVRYYLNLVLVDEEDRRYFKQQVSNVYSLD